MALPAAIVTAIQKAGTALTEAFALPGGCNKAAMSKDGRKIARVANVLEQERTSPKEKLGKNY